MLRELRIQVSLELVFSEQTEPEYDIEASSMYMQCCIWTIMRSLELV